MVLTGPKWPLTLPNSSPNTMWKNLVSNLPAAADVVVTFIASCPPATSACSLMGEMAALLTGAEVVNVWSTTHSRASQSLAVQSAEPVINNVFSLFHCQAINRNNDMNAVVGGCAGAE
jgi:hypothetical protein